jgi:hypothetical protein
MEEKLFQQLNELISKHTNMHVDIVVPDPDDAATLESWNKLRKTITESVHNVDELLANMRKELDSFDESTSIFAREITSLALKTKNLLVTLSITPDEERFFENFNTDDSIDPTSVVGWDQNTKALSLPIETELLVNNRVSEVKITHAPDTNTIRRNLGHLSGHAEDNSDNLPVVSPDDRLNLNQDPNVLLDPTPHNIVEVEQVILLTGGQNQGPYGITGTGVVENILTRTYSPTPQQHLAIPSPEQVVWSRPTRSPEFPSEFPVTIQVRFSAPININKTLLVQQSLDGTLGRLKKVSLTLESGRTKVIQSFSDSSDKMGNIFSTERIIAIQWELIKTYNARSPISFQHWVGEVPEGAEPRHLFVETAFVEQDFPSLDPDYQLAVLEKILNAGSPLEELDPPLPPWLQQWLQ